MAKARIERIPLGTLPEAEHPKEYYLSRYWNRESGALEKEVIEWRIPDIREAVRAEAGMKILSADYSQIEVRLMAHLSGDIGLKAALNSGKDIHCYMANDCFGGSNGFTYDDIFRAYENEDDPRADELVPFRSRVKVVTFGVPYGAGPPRVAAMTGMSLEEAARFIDAYFRRYPMLRKWLDNQGSMATHHGYTTSPHGRKRFYILPSPEARDAEREQVYAQIRRWAGNHPIQAGNVDMLKPAMAAIYRRVRKEIWPSGEYRPNICRILFVVHDEIVMTAIDELAEKGGPVETIMKEEMQRAYDDIIPDIVNKIDVGIGERWVKK